MQSDPYSGDVSIVGPGTMIPPAPSQPQFSMQQQQLGSNRFGQLPQHHAVADVYNYSGDGNIFLIISNSLSRTFQITLHRLLRPRIFTLIEVSTNFIKVISECSSFRLAVATTTARDYCRLQLEAVVRRNGSNPEIVRCP